MREDVTHVSHRNSHIGIDIQDESQGVDGWLAWICEYRI